MSLLQFEMHLLGYHVGEGASINIQWYVEYKYIESICNQMVNVVLCTLHKDGMLQWWSCEC